MKNTYMYFFNDLNHESFDDGDGCERLCEENRASGPADMNAECATHVGGSLFSCPHWP